MVNTKGKKRKKGVVKKKSLKSRAILGSKRRLSRFGKEQKKGHKGIQAYYITRMRAIKNLQISLRDFRRLCILKGIYPRDPKRKPKDGKQKVYYHVKDITYLAHEPLLEKFRDFKTFMKKVRRQAGRGNYGDAQKMYFGRERYTLDHLVRERYPQFSDAMADLDDAMCMVHLFASLPAEKRISADSTKQCLRLTLEWQKYVVGNNLLRKVFVSVKGMYYRAEVQGVPVTWLVPHKFSYDVTAGVDFRVMNTFLEFYMTLARFVLYKLYHSAGLVYPPKLDLDKLDAGDYLSSVSVEARDAAAAAAAAAAPGKSASTSAAAEAGEDAATTTSETAQQTASKERIASLSAALREAAAAAAADEEDDKAAAEAEEMAQGGTSGVAEDAAFSTDATAQAMLKKHRETVHKSSLFSGLRFFLSREVPTESLEFCIGALGGSITRSETEAGITHQIVDRPMKSRATGKQRSLREDREYVQPQWVYDSLNASVLLPVEKYKAGAKLPPHLSPFVDDRKEGYVPTYRSEVEKIQAGAKAADGDAMGEDDDEEEDSDDDDAMDEDEDEEEERHAAELEQERKGIMFSAADEEDEDEEEDGEEEEEEEDDNDNDDDDEEGEEEEEEEELTPAQKRKAKRAAIKAQAEAEKKDFAVKMMKKKDRRIYQRMQYGIKRKREAVEKLENKRKAIESSNNGRKAKKKKKAKQSSR